MTPVRRGTTFHLRKAVPRRYAAVEQRKVVWISLHTDSETVARQKAPLAWAQLEEAWEARLAGDSEDAERRFESARDLAQARGYRYLKADQVAKLPREEFLDRVRAGREAGQDRGGCAPGWGEGAGYHCDAGARSLLDAR